MIYNIREYARLQICVFVISVIAWSVILTKSPISSCCSAAGSELALPNWILMLVAMMAPMLAPSLYHIILSSFARRQMRSIALFVAGYGVIWIAMGIIMLAAATPLFSLPRFLPAIAVGLIALVWQASPFKQRCLNRCHRHRQLAAFGLAADRDVLSMGLEHGFWCVGSCWAMMLFPILLPEGHFVAMAAVSVLMFCERLDRPRTPSWRLRGFGSAFCYLHRRLRIPQSGPPPFATIASA
jgi:predicted metal-binding membrane protein